MVRVGVIGAGLTGLSTAYTIQHMCPKARASVIERDDQVGGLAKTLNLERARADLGPHRFHTKNKEVMDHVLSLVPDMLSQRRVSHIYMEGKMFKYPLEGVNLMALMPPHVSLAIFVDYMKAVVSRERGKDKNFREWVVSRFGRKIFDIYFGPYTEKVWGLDCTRISADWADQRIKLLNLKEAVVGMLSPKSKAHEKLVSEFRYPRGGIGSISRTLAGAIKAAGGRIYTSAPVTRVSTSPELAVERSGQREEVDFLVNTAPPAALLGALDPPPPSQILSAAFGLRFRALVFVYLVLKRKRLARDHWIYFPQHDVMFNRVSEVKNFSPGLVPEDKTVVCAEVTCNKGDEVWSMEDISAKVAAQMEEVGLVRSDEVLDSFVHREPEAYPVYDLEYKENLDTVIGYLDGLNGIASVGRNGMFLYNNMDHAIAMGRAAGRAVAEFVKGKIGSAEASRKAAARAVAVLGQDYLG